jgi:phosphate:Na+ symporter
MVDIGELNIPEAEKATMELAEITKDMFSGYIHVFKNPGSDLGAEVLRLKQLEDDADLLTHDITEYLVRTSAAELNKENARSIGRMLRIVAELEEVSDAIYRLIQITNRKYKKDRMVTGDVAKDIIAFAEKVLALIDLYMDVLENGADEEKLKQARDLEDETDKLRKQQNKAAMDRMSADPTTVKAEMVVIEMNNQFELIANYGLNVVQTAFYLEHYDDIPDKYEK